jgi:hypothetical protein
MTLVYLKDFYFTINIINQNIQDEIKSTIVFYIFNQQEKLLSDTLNSEVAEEKQMPDPKEEEKLLEVVEEEEKALEAPDLPKVCQKYAKKMMECQSEEIILAGFERSGVMWTAHNLEVITAHYTCQVGSTARG